MHRSMPVTRSFRKPVPLPTTGKWMISPEDVSISGRVISFLETKGFFFNSLSKVLPRLVTVTKQGVMIIYMTSNEGHVLKLSTAKRIVTRTTKKDKKCVCEVEVVFTFGAVTLFFPADETAMKWREILWTFLEKRQGPIRRLAITRNTDAPIDRPIEVSDSMTTLGPSPDRECPLSPTIDVNEKTAPVDVTGPVSIVSETFKAPKSPPPTQLESIRKGYHGVSSIRQMLERKIGVDKAITPKRSFNTQQKKLETVPEEPQKSIRRSMSLRSASAPHIDLKLPSSKTSFKSSIIVPAKRVDGIISSKKIDAEEEYDGCFHSVRA